VETDKFTSAPHISLAHADIIGSEACIEHDLTLACRPYDMNVWAMAALVARVHDDAKAIDFEAGHF